jgi:non-heme chloroperoxidase
MATAQAPDGTRIAYSVHGDGPLPVVLLHAWAASRRYFDETIDHLDRSAERAIAIDLRGHGDSDKPDGPLSWELLADDVLAVADAAGAERFVAVGHSLGGKLAQCLAVVEPARVQALVLVASPSAARLPIPPFARGWANLAGYGQALLDASVTPFLQSEVPQAVLQRFAHEAARIPQPYLQGTLDLLSETSFVDRLGAVTIPVLVVSSRADTLHTTEQDLIASFPHARIDVIDAGPDIPMEQPLILARTIDRFLGTVRGGARPPAR